MIFRTVKMNGNVRVIRMLDPDTGILFEASVGTYITVKVFSHNIIKYDGQEAVDLWSQLGRLGSNNGSCVEDDVLKMNTVLKRIIV